MWNIIKGNNDDFSLKNVLLLLLIFKFYETIGKYLNVLLLVLIFKIHKTNGKYSKHYVKTVKLIWVTSGILERVMNVCAKHCEDFHTSDKRKEGFVKHATQNFAI